MEASTGRVDYERFRNRLADTFGIDATSPKVFPRDLPRYIEATGLTPALTYSKLVKLHNESEYHSWCWRPHLTVFGVNKFGILESFPLAGEIVYRTASETLTLHAIFDDFYDENDFVQEAASRIDVGMLVENLSGGGAARVVRKSGYSAGLEFDGEEQLDFPIYQLRASEETRVTGTPSDFKMVQPEFKFFDAAMMDDTFVMIYGRKREEGYLFYIVDESEFEWMPAARLKPWVAPQIDKALLPPKDPQIEKPMRIPSGAIAVAVIGLLLAAENFI
jgi:hypothetical protein